MKKTAVLSAVALAIGLGSATSGFAADNRIGVTIYKYDDNFMSRNKMTFLLFSSIKTQVQKLSVAMSTLTMLVPTRKNQA